MFKHPVKTNAITLALNEHWIKRMDRVIAFVECTGMSFEVFIWTTVEILTQMRTH